MPSDSEPKPSPKPVTLRLSEPGHRFVDDQIELHWFLGWIAGAVSAWDLVGTEDEMLIDPFFSDDVPQSGELGRGASVLRAHRHQLFEMLLCRTVDSYLTYIAELLRLLYTERPETLRAHAERAEKRGQQPESIPLDVVLEHDSMQTLVAYIVDRRVNDLSFKGMRAIHDYLSDRLGFEVFPNADELATATEAIEIRNLIVHNRGVVSRIFVERTPNTSFLVGDRIEVTPSMMQGTAELFSRSVQDVDARASRKWRLPREDRIKTRLGAKDD